MKKLFLAALALSCSTAFAGNAYVGVNVGSANQKASADDAHLTLSSTAVGINAGYQITPMFGAEVGYVQFGEASVTGGGSTIGTKPKSAYLAATATFPVAPQLAVIVKGGVARSKTTFFASNLDASESSKKSSAMFSVGATYVFTPAIAAVIEYATFGKVAKENGVSLKVNQVAAGLRYSF